jgi:hypothetical protein
MKAPNDEPSSRLARRLWEASSAAVGLPATDAGSIEVLVAAGELVLALETLCTQIYEYDIEVGRALRTELEDLGEVLGVHSAYLLGDPWVEGPHARHVEPDPIEEHPCD